MNEPTAMELSSEAPSTPTRDSTDSIHLADQTTPVISGARRRTRPPKAPKNAPGDVASDEDATPTRKRKRITRMTDSGRMPALRLNGYVGRQRTEPKPTVVYDPRQTPGHLRLTRLVIGLALLALAWSVSLLVVMLTESLWDVFPHQPSLTVRFGLYVLGAIGLVWLAVVGVAMIVVGALSLTLALTRRGW